MAASRRTKDFHAAAVVRADRQRGFTLVDCVVEGLHGNVASTGVRTAHYVSERNDGACISDLAKWIGGHLMDVYIGP